MPRVSILIPCFNSEKWIAQSIHSALAQTHDDKEIFVLDDGSTDGSLDIIKSFGDSVGWESGPNRGGNVARNRLLELATGTWLQYLDSDDYLHPEKIATQISESPSNDADVLWSPSIFEYWNDGDLDFQEIQTLHDQDPWIALIKWKLPQTGAALWSKQAIQNCGGWKADQPCCQEHELYSRLLRHGASFQFCSTALSVYRQWTEDSVCRKDPGKTYRYRIQVIKSAGEHLEQTGLMTPDRRDAIAASLTQCARGIYRYDKNAAVELARETSSKYPEYSLTDEDWSPQLYRVIYKTFGFKTAETVATATRSIRGLPSVNPNR